ncbi:MAG: hypothetical protein KY455_11885 [Euryarchaeota archaeon]|nr:hypothetical protein [Euryarchaeota archaeon]
MRQTTRSLLLLLALTAVALTAGHYLKASCSDVPWDGSQFTTYCYSDIIALYHTRGLDESVPYLPDQGPSDVPADERAGFLEYPVLTGLLVGVAGKLTASGLFGWSASGLTFLRWNSLLLAPFALGTTYLLVRLVGPRRAALFAIAPPIVLYSSYNWDILAVFFLVLGIERLERGLPLQSGLAIGLGGAAKLFPLVAAPFLFLLLVRRTHLLDGAPRAAEGLWRSLLSAGPAWRFALGGVAAIIGVHIPLVLAGGGPLYLEMLRFHSGRVPNTESLWTALSFLLGRIGTPVPAESLALASLPALALGSLGLATWIWRRTPSVAAVAYAPLLLLLVTTVFFSLQYVLWVLPLFALVTLPTGHYTAFLVGDLAVLGTLFPLFANDNPAAWEATFLIVSVAVLVRATVFLVVLGWLVRRSGGVSAVPHDLAAPRQSVTRAARQA